MSTVVYKIYYWILFAICHIFYKFHVSGNRHINDDAAVICANHSSMFDPLMIMVAIRNKNGYNQCKFLAKSELASVPIIGAFINFLIVYVRRGESDIAAVKQSIAHLKSGGRLVVFPEGTRVKDGESVDVKTGVIMMSMRSGAKLQPVYVTECRKPVFCRKPINIVFGEPYSPQKNPGEGTSEAYRREAEELMRRIYQLGESVK